MIIIMKTILMLMFFIPFCIRSCFKVFELIYKGGKELDKKENNNCLLFTLNSFSYYITLLLTY